MFVTIIGGGIFGCWIAIELSNLDKIKQITVIEKNDELMNEASKKNQHRFHLGYHYPKSESTIQQIKKAKTEFENNFSDCIFPIENNLYFISKKDSKTTTEQFENIFAKDNIERVDPALYKSYVNLEEVDSCFRVGEKGLNNLGLKTKILNKLDSIEKIKIKKNLKVDENTIGEIRKNCDLLINASYSNLHLTSNMDLKYEVCILPLILNPYNLKSYAFTVMDGNFSSLYPTNNENIYTVSSVQKTPIFKSDNIHDIINFKNTISDEIIQNAGKHIINSLFRHFKDTEIKIIDNYVTIKVKPKSDPNDIRTSCIEMPDANTINVLQGKITTICDVANEIREICQKLH